MPACCVCGQDGEHAALHKCPSPECPNHVCTRHGLLYEIDDALDSGSAYYCSRRCWNTVRRRYLPFAKELILAALFLFVVIPLYLFVVSLFV